MLKKSIATLKVIVKQLAIAFFFASLFIFLIFIFFAKKIDATISLINQMSVKEVNRTTEKINIDSDSKRLSNYPTYGEIFATIEIPTINVSANIVEGDNLDLIKKNIGHYAGSYFPGEGGSIVLAAHNSQAHFGKLPDLKIGSKIIIKTSYGTYTYKVTTGQIIKATDLEKNMDIKDDKETLLMYTCYPVSIYGFKDKRYVITASLEGEE